MDTRFLQILVSVSYTHLTVATDGYDAIQVGFEDKREKLATKAHKGHVAKAETAPKRFIKEFRYDCLLYTSSTVRER